MIIKGLVQIIWFLLGRCVECGGPVHRFTPDEAYCINCGVRN